MKRISTLFALVLCLFTFAFPVLAQNEAAGPNDTSQAHDYAKHIGKSTDKKLSTGWKAPKGNRTEKTTDYTRTTKSGKTQHVHGYYHKPKS